jgi:HPt (histidine-containing phosphotransfer) domain-containing protein
MTPLTKQAVPAFDRESALARVGGDLDLLREIAALFLSESAPALRALRSAVAARDAVAIERKAHELKGSIATFGGGAAFQDALELELKGRTRDLQQLDWTMQRFEASLACLCDDLRTLVN